MRLQLRKIRQPFDRPRVADLETPVRDGLRAIESQLKPGANIAVAVGSRGVSNIAQIVKTTVEFIRGRGASPFIVPAMGSHGGACAEGQAEILAGFGITQDAVGAPIRSSMETMQLPTADGSHVYMDRQAYESDGVIVINRVKPHTDYHGEFESGLVKMCVIGLGKHQQALEIHRMGIEGLSQLMPAAAKVILATGKVLAAIATIENAYHETMAVHVLPADQIMAQEPKLLAVAKSNMPRLPVDQIDVLLVDQMGKNISGLGMDSNIIGRIGIPGQEDPNTPQIRSIVVCDLTDASHGNAVGIGLADLTTKRLYEKIDFDATYENVVTSSFVERGKVPLVAETDERALEIALRSIQLTQAKARIVRIRDTLQLDEVQVSDAVMQEIEGREGMETIGQPADLFDGDGAMMPF